MTGVEIALLAFWCLVIVAGLSAAASEIWRGDDR